MDHVDVTSTSYPYQKVDTWWHAIVILVVLRTNSGEQLQASSAFDLIMILSVLREQYRYKLGGTDDTP